MKSRVKKLALFLGLILVGVLISETRRFAREFRFELSMLSRAGVSVPDRDDLALAVRKESIRRFELYDRLIGSYASSHGMVVWRDLTTGNSRHECDSLLFSSLRYTALYKLGYYQRAQRAWQDIRGAYIQKQWRRHPDCAAKAISRDMLLGLLVALSTFPPDGREILEDLNHKIERHSGFFADGPIYVSYLTPQMAELMRLLASVYGIPAKELPPSVRYSFATRDLNILEISKGYESHLVALGLWLEMEILDLNPALGGETAPRNLIALLADVEGQVATSELFKIHWSFVAEKLYHLDSRNAFFTYLYARANGEDTENSRLLMQAQLNEMSQFPRGFLPMDCDRGSDYLWQRDSQEMDEKEPNCNTIHPGVDYLWMTALLLGK